MHAWQSGDWMPDPWMILWGGSLWLVMIGIVAGLVVYAVHHFFGRRGRLALDLLEQAYARGDIKREEFLQKRADLLGV